MRVIEYVRRMRRKRDKNKDVADEVIKRERVQGEIYKKAKQTTKYEQEALETKLKNERLIEMRNKKRVRVGKQPMFRSTKRSIKKVEAPKEIDPEKLAFRLYLGQLDEDDTAASQK